MDSPAQRPEGARSRALHEVFQNTRCRPVGTNSGFNCHSILGHFGEFAKKWVKMTRFSGFCTPQFMLISQMFYLERQMLYLKIKTFYLKRQMLYPKIKTLYPERQTFYLKSTTVRLKSTMLCYIQSKTLRHTVRWPWYQPPLPYAPHHMYSKRMREPDWFSHKELLWPLR